MIKALLAAGLLATGLSVAGCTAPIPADQDPNFPLQVSVTDYWLQNDIGVTVLAPQHVGNGQLKIPIQIYNKRDHEIPIDYQYWFVDKGGVQVDNPPGWEFERLPPRGYKQIAPTSMSAAAADFRVQIRRAK